MKTARMMSVACHTGAVVGGADAEQANLYSDLGMSFGRAYQLADDLIDQDHAVADSEVMALLESELGSLREHMSHLPQYQYTGGLRTMVEYLVEIGSGLTDGRRSAAARSRLNEPSRARNGVGHGR